MNIRCSWEMDCYILPFLIFLTMTRKSRADWETSCRNMTHNNHQQITLAVSINQRTCKTCCTRLMHFVSCHGRSILPLQFHATISCSAAYYVMKWNIPASRTCCCTTGCISGLDMPQSQDRWAEFIQISWESVGSNRINHNQTALNKKQSLP